jgi:hypothetical protein
MTSERKIAANRANGRKSCGPRTLAGKASASRNALRHGLAAMIHRDPGFFPETEGIARALCGGDSRPCVYEAALKFAEYQVLLCRVRAQKAAVVKRLRDGTAVPLAKGDNSVALAKASSRQSKLAVAELQRIKARLQANAGQSNEPFVLGMWSNAELHELCNTPANLDERARYEKEIAPPEDRDELDALYAALPDLMRLALYERRAWSGRKRAFLEFIEAKLTGGRYESDSVGMEEVKHGRSQ